MMLNRQARYIPVSYRAFSHYSGTHLFPISSYLVALSNMAAHPPALFHLPRELRDQIYHYLLYKYGSTIRNTSSLLVILPPLTRKGWSIGQGAVSDYTSTASEGDGYLA